MPLILIVGAADTGRAPIGMVLLRRLLEPQGSEWIVESAGVLGHDGDPATSEASLAVEQIGLDLNQHQARSLTEELASGAQLVLAIDRGVARVVCERFPDIAARVHSLGNLAGRSRDIPDPFKMQLGAWLTYMREIDVLLQAALPRIMRLDAGGEIAAAPAAPAPLITPVAIPALVPPSSLQTEAISRIVQLLQMIAQMPGIIDWAAARNQILADLDAAAGPSAPDGMNGAYAGLIRAALAMTPAIPNATQSVTLQAAVERLAGLIALADLNALSTCLATWNTA